MPDRPAAAPGADPAYEALRQDIDTLALYLDAVARRCAYEEDIPLPLPLSLAFHAIVARAEEARDG